MDTFISRSPEETRALGETWGKAATLGLVIGLTGDLGAGKTELVKGIARGLGIKEKVLSPTFALIHEYGGSGMPLFHIDLYRLDSAAQIVGAGLEEYLYQRRGVTVIEWVERWNESSDSASKTQVADYRHVTIETISETERRIICE